MPFKSESQRRKFYAMLDRGEISQETFDKWERETKGKFPEKTAAVKGNPIVQSFFDEIDKISAAKFYSAWKHGEPRDTARRYVEVFGPPDEVEKGSATWNDIANFGGPTVIKDEEIAHGTPVKHIDFVYSTRSIRVPADKVGVLAKASGSIMVDQLKQEVTARCHYLIKNAVTLGFVEDVAAGKIPDKGARQEYARRIKNNIHPKWFKDPLGEYKKTLAVDVAHHLEINK
jgi:hypothetical protein